MATSNMTAIPAAKGFLNYCLDSKGKKERVQFVYSTFTDPGAELKLFAGKKYNGIDFRISFSPDDRKLKEPEFKAIVDEVTKKYLGNRNFIAVMHNDTEHQHIHIISTFLDENGRPLDFSGKAKYKEAARRQAIVDEVCKKHGLSTLPREENKFNSRDGIPGYKYKGERYTKAEKVGKQPWRVEAKKHIRDCESLENLERRGVKIVRESEETLTLEYQGKKMRLNRLFPQLKTRADLEKYIAESLERERSFINSATKNQKEGKKMKDEKREQLRRAEDSFTRRMHGYMEDMLRHGISDSQVQERVKEILAHHTESENIQERWSALRRMQEVLREKMNSWYEEKQRIRREQYEAQRREREREHMEKRQMQTLHRVLSSNNPIVAFVAAITLLIHEIKKRQEQQEQYRFGDINRDGIAETFEQELLKQPAPGM